MPRLGTRRTKCLQDENPLYFISLPSGYKYLENKYLSKKSVETKVFGFKYITQILHIFSGFLNKKTTENAKDGFIKVVPSRVEFQRLERFLSMFYFTF